MSEYAGLNLPQLLELLEPVVLPAPVPWWPVTPGWWVLGGWFFTLALLGAWRLRQRWLANGYRRAALAEIEALRLAGGSAAAIATVVKRTALVAFGRDVVAGLAGEEWSQFLLQTAAGDPLVARAAVPLAAAAYRPDADPAPLLEPARRWIMVHRV